ncbi:MAG: hypothetical protein NTV51_10935 [Verrucomicrobia bacterium]|nr:hypothetical protein [Verrucomicrobiota bacterium]
MRKIVCVSPTETFTIVQADGGCYCCPVCGVAGLAIAPYAEDGGASFEMCECGFEFGFDDTPLASPEAVDGVRANWKRWRRKVIDAASTSSASLDRLERQLKNIGIRLAVDLIDVEDEKN